MFEEQTPTGTVPPVAPFTPPPAPRQATPGAEDIFAGVESSGQSGMPAGQLPKNIPTLPEDEPNNKMLMIVGGSVAGLLVLAVIIWLVLSSFNKAPKADTTVSGNTETEKADANVELKQVGDGQAATEEQNQIDVTKNSTATNDSAVSDNQGNAVISENNNTLTNDSQAVATTTGDGTVPSQGDALVATTSVPVNPTGAEVASKDTDGDNLLDSEEAEYKTNPLKSDTDEDNLTDYEEVKVYGSDPNKADSDSDGYIDGTEVQKGYNPNGVGKLFISSPKN